MHNPKTLPNESAQPRRPKEPQEPELEVRGPRSVALSRLIEEVRNNGNDDPSSPTAYNRTYHRHNR